MSTRVLVTGAKGQLALTIKDLYNENKDGIEFTFVDRYGLDITNIEAVKSYFKKHQIDYCINCAAYTNVENAEDDTEKAFQVNAEGVKNIARQCKKKDVVLIHISTDYVFNGEKTTPYTERDKTQPINEYGKSKLLGEKYIQEISSKYFILRTSWLYSRFGKNFLKTIISKVNADEELKVIDSQLGSPTSTHIVAEFCYHLIKNKEHVFGIYNVISTGYTSWFGFAREIAGYFPEYDKNKIQSVSFFKTKAKRPAYSVLNNKKAQEASSKIVNWQVDLKRVITPILK